MAKARKSAKQSEPITPKEIIENEPPVNETLDLAPELQATFEAQPQVASEIELLNGNTLTIIDTAEGDDVPIASSEHEAPVWASSFSKIVVAERTEEESLLLSLEGKEGFTPINDFFAGQNEQFQSKRIKALLQKMVESGSLFVENDAHLLLGGRWYDAANKQQHYSLLNTEIKAATKI